MSENNGKVAKSYTIELSHAVMIDAHAKASGMNSSEALRDILDQWAADRMAEAGVQVQEGDR